MRKLLTVLLISFFAGSAIAADSTVTADKQAVQADKEKLTGEASSQSIRSRHHGC